MKIEEQTRVEIQQALGYPPPSPSDPGFAAFYSRLETEHPQLASQLLAGLQHEEGEGGTDSQAFFPEQEAQARTRAQARGVLQRLFYRQDHLTDEWTVSKGKVGMAGLFGACLLLGPMLLVGTGSGAPSGVTQKSQEVPAAQVQAAAPPPAVASVPEPPPADPPLADVPAAPPPADLPPVAEAPVADAPLPEVTAPTAVEAPPVPIDSLPEDPVLQRAVAAAPPPPPAGATIYKAAKTNAAASSTIYLATSRTGGDKAGKDSAGDPAKGGDPSNMTLFKEDETISPDVPLTMFAEEEPRPEATKTGPAAVQAVAPPVKTSADYLLGTSLKAELSTGLIATQGRGAMPVLAKSESGEIFSGLAILSGAGRVEISFTSVLIGGQLKTVNARAYDPSGLPGLKVKTRDVAPSLAADLSRAAASGVAGYVEQLGDQTETVIEGKTTTITTQPPKLQNIIAGAIARLFSTPPTQKALERIAQVDRGTPLLITVMGEGATPPSKAPETAATPGDAEKP